MRSDGTDVERILNYRDVDIEGRLNWITLSADGKRLITVSSIPQSGNYRFSEWDLEENVYSLVGDYNAWAEWTIGFDWSPDATKIESVKILV
jgi:hypothetical protein